MSNPKFPALKTRHPFLWRVFNAQKRLPILPDLSGLATFYSPLHGEKDFYTCFEISYRQYYRFITIYKSKAA
jgi:hypothetical protein